MGNYNTYLGDKKALQFPVMCDGYVKIDYNKNIATSPYGIWEHTGDFTLEVLVTPYDCNGCGELRDSITTYQNGILTSQKTMPAVGANRMLSFAAGAGRQDEKYLPAAFRYGDNIIGTSPISSPTKHKMMIFSTSNFKLYLENTTSHNHNQPAEYKIVCEMLISNNHVVTSPNIIRARDTNYNLIDDVKYMGSIQNLVDTGATISNTLQGSPSSMTFYALNAALYVHDNMEIFDEDGKLIGAISVQQPSNFVVDTSTTLYTKATFDATGGKVYIKPLLEAPYLEGLYHIAVSYSDGLGKITIFINGAQAVTDIHIDRTNDIDTNFSFGNDNIYLGQDASLIYPETRKTQFMGEIHELAVTINYKSEFSSLYTLLPQYKNLILYLNFEED